MFGCVELTLFRLSVLGPPLSGFYGASRELVVIGLGDRCSSCSIFFVYI